MQNYTEIDGATTSVRASLGLLDGNIDTVMSNSSGAGFPTENLVLHMFCYREDLGKLYQLLSLDGPIWKLIYDSAKNILHAEDAAETYLALAGGTLSGTLAIETNKPTLELVDADGSAKKFVVINDAGTFWVGEDDGAAQNARLKIAAGGLVTIPGKLQVGGGEIFLNNAGGNLLRFLDAGVAAPSFGTRSAGTRVVLHPALGGTLADYAIGIEFSTLWYGIPSATQGYKHRWYGGTTPLMTLDGTGVLSLTNKVSVTNAVPALELVESDKDGKTWFVMSENGALRLSENTTAGAGTRLRLDPGGNVFLAENGGKVGIGVSDPTFGLDIAADATALPAPSLRVRASTHETSRRAGIQIGSWLVGQDNAGAGVLDFFLRDGAAGRHRLLIDAAGRIGAGTVTPRTRLDIVGSETQLHLSAADDNKGAYIFANSFSGVSIASNAYSDGSTWIAKDTNGAILSFLAAGGLTAHTFSDATIGAAPTLTEVARFDTTGPTFPGDIKLSGGGDGRGLRSTAHGTYLYSASSSLWATRSGSGLVVQNISGSNQGFLYFDTGGFGLLSSDGSWRIRTFIGGQTLYGTSYFSSNGNGGLQASGGYGSLDVVGYGPSGYQGLGFVHSGYKLMMGGIDAPLNAGIYNGDWKMLVQNGSIYAPGDIVAHWSDIRLKTGLTPIADWETILAGITGYRFRWNERGRKRNGKDADVVEIGLVAQELREVLPQAVAVQEAQCDADGQYLDENGQPMDEPYLTVKPDRLIPVLVEAVKALTARVKAIEARLDGLV